MSFPTFHQYDQMDCGPTCLRIISAHYGKRYSLEGLRERAHITREGVSMLGIAEVAENIGFRTMGVKVSVEKLREAPLPCVVHWNQNHFVVLYKAPKPPQGAFSKSPRGGFRGLFYISDPLAACTDSQQHRRRFYSRLDNAAFKYPH
ncbi:hypothetical protein FACS1894180_6150 [Bacteroidia bacterium]|nr:hypothetical protein FACS1894180_6150 [Bacteroidia bacterium]